jgi:hypothetical protein
VSAKTPEPGTITANWPPDFGLVLWFVSGFMG